MYQQRIKEIAPTYNPRHVEAFMRSEHGTLDDLSPSRFHREVLIAAACIRGSTPDFAEKLAKSYGL